MLNDSSDHDSKVRNQKSVQVLDNIRVVDWTEAMAGPFCAMLLGDFGASVVKVERPRVGDQSRGWGPPFVGPESAYFLSANRNKRSITLNLDHAQSIEIMRRLISEADVFVHNQPKLETLTKRGLDYESLAAANPRLVYCAISSYGWTGPKVGLPGYDILAQAEAGLMSLTGDPHGQPVRYPIPLADISCGVYAAMGILGALLARERSGKGQFLDLSLLDSQLTWLSNVGSSYLNAGVLPQRLGNAHPNVAPYDLFQTRDLGYIFVAVATEPLWLRFCRVLGIEETLGRDPRFAINRARIENRDALMSALRQIFGKETAQNWLARFRDAGIPSGAVQSIDHALNDCHTQARKAIVELQHPQRGLVRSIATPVKMSATPIQYRYAPPLLGEHTTAVLAELGLSVKDIQSLRNENAI